MIHLKQLENSFDDARADQVLRVDVGDLTTPLETVSKSLYNFALDTPEGLQKLVELLPVLSKSILTSIYKELFIGYPAEKLSSRQMAIELKGFLLDLLAETGPVDEN
jgi:hypothetical protein